MRDLLDDAVQRGAKILCGGNARPDLGPNFFEPTVIIDVDSTMRLFEEETFGPILAIQTVNTPKKPSRTRTPPASRSPRAFGPATLRTVSQSPRNFVPAPSWSTTPSATSPSPKPLTAAAASAAGAARTAKLACLRWCKPNTSTSIDLPRREKPWWYRYGADLERAADAFLQFEYDAQLRQPPRHARGALKTMFRDHGL